jgi:hypothetical protein
MMLGMVLINALPTIAAASPVADSRLRTADALKLMSRLLSHFLATSKSYAHCACFWLDETSTCTAVQSERLDARSRRAVSLPRRLHSRACQLLGS